MVPAGNIMIDTDINGTNDTNGITPIFIKESYVSGASNPTKEH